MNCRTTQVLAGALVLLMSLTVPLSLAITVAAEPVEVHTTLPPIGTAVAMASVVRENSNVYVIGGCLGLSPDISNVVSSVQIYNITTGETTYGASMPTGTAAAAYGLGTDGKIYIAGGWNSTSGSYLMRVQIYDPALDSWTLATNFTPAPIGRSASAMGTDGKLYAFGGGWSTNITLIYTPSTDRWVYGHDLPTSAWDSAAVTISSTEILLIGGNGGALSQSVAYNPVANSWTTAGTLAQPTAFGSAVVARDGFVYLFGGSSTGTMADPSPYSGAQIFNVSSQTWELSTAYLSSGRLDAGSVNDAFGRILVVAGWDGSSVVGTVDAFVVANVVSMQSIQIVAPTAGSIVSGTVAVEAKMLRASIFSSYMAIDFFVDGVRMGTHMQVSDSTFLWDTTALVDGSNHVLMVRGYSYDGTINDASVSVTVSAHSLEERVAALEQGIADLQAKLGQTDSNLTQLKADLAVLQAQLTGLQAGLAQMGNGLTAMGAGQAAAMASLNVTLANLQLQLDAFQKQIDRVETKADTAGTYGMITLILVIIVIILIALVLMMGRNRPARYEVRRDDVHRDGVHHEHEEVIEE